MISHGDEIGRTQGGNNNTYAQDNEIAWMDWDLDDEALRILDFARAIIHFRRAHPTLRRRRFSSAQHFTEAPRNAATFCGYVTMANRCKMTTGTPGLLAPSCYGSTAVGFRSLVCEAKNSR